MVVDPIPAHSAFRGGQVGQAYNEAAFRYFLAIDRNRARRSKRFIYLVIAAIQESAGRPVALSDTAAAALFLGLGAAIREVDFVGWYRDGRVAAAVLAQGPSAPAEGAGQAIGVRVQAELKKRLPAGQAPGLRVRVFRLGGRTGG